MGKPVSGSQSLFRVTDTRSCIQTDRGDYFNTFAASLTSQTSGTAPDRVTLCRELYICRENISTHVNISAFSDNTLHYKHGPRTYNMR